MERSSDNSVLSLPVVSAAPAPLVAWEGFSPANVIEERPEPFQPQGAYNLDTDADLVIPLLPERDKNRPVELLAPAGGPEAACAAFHFGADAIYLGLKKFSARAEAENFTLEELNAAVAHAHSLQPRRRVFVTINTLIRQDELPELLETLDALVEIGVDAVIVQDLGVYHAVRRWFPQLELHGSTQMSVHNRAGAEALKHLGFTRVVLARELTFEEVHDITGTAGVETEVFIHGALCYSYSGLCLFSAQTLGRSGNRGKCAYSCRDSYQVEGAPDSLRDGSPVRRDPANGFPFSMKDLALPDHLPALRAAGVSCFKIEGRKKSPLYVATTTDYYRRLLDGRLAEDERPAVEADLQTVFSRPWTRLFVHSHLDKEVADRDTVGHRGAAIGAVARVRKAQSKDYRLRFRTSRALQKHDGLQIDLPTQGKPFGFAVDQLWVLQNDRDAKPREVFEAAADSLVEVTLPREHPEIPEGAPVYCSSSQEVKQRYQFEQPKADAHRVKMPLRIEANLSGDRLIVKAETTDAWGVTFAASRELAGPFAAAQDPAAVERGAKEALGRLGASGFSLESLAWRNPQALFVPASKLNPLRRELVAELEGLLARGRKARVERLTVAASCQLADSSQRLRLEDGQESPAEVGKLAACRYDDVGWSIKVDRVGMVAAFEEADWAGVDEVLVDITRDHPLQLREGLADLARRVGREKIRLALPALTRRWEEKGLVHKIDMLRQAGWNKWEAANLSAWSYLGIDPANRPRQQGDDPASPTRQQGQLDLATDWSIYVLNRLAARQLLDMGVTRFALSPEDGFANWRSLWNEFGGRAVLIVHQDTPLFLAESCAYANLIGGCPGKANCRFESMEMVSSHGEKVTALDYHCRTIVLNQGPFCLSDRLDEIRAAGAKSLRADFVYRPYEATEVRRRWRLIRAGQPLPGAHAANWDRGIL